MFVQSDVLKKLAQEVMAAHGETFAHLTDRDHPCRIRYLACDRMKTSNGKAVFADTTKVSDKMKAISDTDFIITFYNPACETLSAEALKILMFHELMHVGYDSDQKYWIVPHDVEDFECIITRYGIHWTDIGKETKDKKDHKQTEG